MKINILFLSLVLALLLFSSADSEGFTKAKISEVMETGISIHVPSSLAHVSYASPFEANQVLASPGRVVGTTHYDSQTHGSTGNRILRDGQGGMHIVWMNGIGEWSGNRWVFYNFREQGGSWSWDDIGTSVSITQGAGFPQVDVTATACAVVSYHNFSSRQYSLVAIDSSRGSGQFAYHDIPDSLGENRCIWPYIVVDRWDRIHIIAHEYTSSVGPRGLIYTRSEDGGNSWIDIEVVDTLVPISAVLTASRVSDKVAIVYTHPRDIANPDRFNNDICYRESTDGINWDWENNLVNVTNYQYEDTLRAYCDCDAIYDRHDNLHLIWNTPYYDEERGYSPADACLLWHWSEASGITLVANGWWPSSPGNWNLSMSKMSLGVDETNALFALWTQFTEEDKSVGGWSNGELYMSYSMDGGHSWSEPVNITNSPSPSCWPGECDSDHWSTLAETVDDSLYLTYINDKDAGAVAQVEGVDTENPVMYLAIPNPAHQVSMTCEALTPILCRGKNFYFQVVTVNQTGNPIDVTMTFTGWPGLDCDSTYVLAVIPRAKTIPVGTNTANYFLRVPDGFAPGDYSASVSFEYNHETHFCCMNATIIQCEPWRMGDNTEWDLVEVDAPETILPTTTELHQNYPNPFNAETNIRYTLTEAGHVTLKIYDISGRLVATLVDEVEEAGQHSITWDASDISSGVYFCKLQTSELSEVKKMNLLK